MVKKKLIVILVAVIAIVLILVFGVGKKAVDTYAYGTEKANLQEFYGVSGDQLAIILMDTKVAEKALYKNNTCYFNMETIDKYIGTGFYYAESYNGGTLMFTVGDGTYETVISESSYTYKGESQSLGAPISFEQNGYIYISADYLSRFFNFDYEVFECRVQLTTEWSEYTAMTVDSNTQIRVQGGIKSEILREVSKGETVKLIEAMEKWSKVKTSDSFIGYIENKKMTNAGVISEIAPVKEDVARVDQILLDKRITLGFHSVAGVAGNDTLSAMVEESRGMNVIAPTWFSLNDNQGGIRNFATSNYVTSAHGKGLWVWGVLDDFNYRNETGEKIDDLAILSNTDYRRALENNIVNAAVNVGLDGISLDFEKVSSECGPHYAQFIKELSVLTHEKGLVLSANNYVPFNYNEHYHIDVQGEYMDYVIIMGYDEHYHGSGNPGSVASFDYVVNGLDKTLEMVASERIINALPFYTIVWKNEGGKVTDSYLTVVNEDEYFRKLGVNYSWDETTCQNYAEWKSGDTTYMVWLEDEDSITAKLNAMNARNIGGVAVWRLGYGTPGVWNVVSLYGNMVATE